MSSVKNNQNTRSVTKRKGQFVIFDAAYPMNTEILKSSIESLLNVLALGGSIRGFPRIPLFGMSIINQSVSQIIQLGPLKGNFSLIYKTLNSLHSEIGDHEQLSESDFFDNLHHALRLAMQEFEPTKFSVVGNEVEMNISVMTRRDGYQIKLNLLPHLEQLKSTRKQCSFQIIELTDSDEWEDYNNPQLQYYQVSLQKGGIENCLKNWLLLPRSDCEHLRLVIGSTIFRCDMEPCLIDSAVVPLAHISRLDADLSIPSASSQCPTDLEVVIPKLEVINRISNAGVSESFVFGNPFLIRPTSYWRIGWPDRESNKENFTAICHNLLNKEEYLVAKLVDSVPSGFFVLIPGRCSLLVKSLVSQELHLETQNHFTVRPSSESVELMKAVLEEIPVKDDYSPSISNLYPQLQRLLLITTSRMDQKLDKVWDNQPSRATAKAGPIKKKAPAKSAKTPRAAKAKNGANCQITDYVQLLKHYNPATDEAGSS